MLGASFLKGLAGGSGGASAGGEPDPGIGCAENHINDQAPWEAMAVQMHGEQGHSVAWNGHVLLP